MTSLMTPLDLLYGMCLQQNIYLVSENLNYFLDTGAYVRTIWEETEKVEVGHLTEYETNFELSKVFNCLRP